MEEAETLADRVLIMADGKILCDGTTQELKIRYGAGYLLKLMCEPQTVVETVMTIVHKFIPDGDMIVRKAAFNVNTFLL